ncbi:helix-turn-helix domain-containing protein [Virgibacillus kekensis]|uniref:Helix-turn-helix domain-containing protein n=1 Tax=Virgibacillus kekensis TaxID=202261 RepID=A0ABV9DH87_9BACI
MLNTRLVGSYISKLRKDRDMTQVQLAEKLNVSHQAVSKWERGDSLPDTGILIEMATLFDTSIDTLLNGGQKTTSHNVGTFITKVHEDKPEEASDLVNNSDTDLESVVAIAPLMKASALGKVTERISSNNFSMDHIVQLAPFIGEEQLEDLVNRIDDAAASWETVTRIAPFLGHETLIGFVDKTVDGHPDMKQLVEVAPFLGNKVDDLVAQMKPEDISWTEFSMLAPFVSKEQLIRLVEESLKEDPDLEKIVQIAPFLGDYTDTLIKRASEDQVNFNSIVMLAPFASQAVLDELMEKAILEDVSNREISQIAPFISSDKLEEMIMKADLEQRDPGMLTQLAPFLKNDSLGKIFTGLLGKSK